MKSKVLSMCLSLFVSVCIWLYVTNVVSPESSEVFRDIPVQLQSVSLLEERGLVVTNVRNPAITLTLTGMGKVTYEIKINGIWFAEQEVDFDTP
jgi:hypothetical protein